MTSSRRRRPRPPSTSAAMSSSRWEAQSVCEVSLHRKRRRQPHAFRTLSLSPLIILLFTLVIFVCRASAVLVSTFDNCLSEAARQSPTRLQFHPILVAADFAESSEALTLTVWGTVTGRNGSDPSGRRRVRVKRGLGRAESYWEGPEEGVDWSQDAPLERRQFIDGIGDADSSQAPATYFGGSYKSDSRFPQNSTYWNYTGVILDQDPSWNAVASTLTNRIVVSSFSVYRNDAYFCYNPTRQLTSASSVNASCPFGNLISAGNQTSDDRNQMMQYRVVPQAMRNNITYLTSELPSFTVTSNLGSSYQFATLGVTLKILSGDAVATQVGCIHIEVTPELRKSNSNILTWLSASVLIIVGVASLMAAMFNPWNGTTDLFRFSSNYGMDDDMLRLVTPGFADCIQWLQFMVLTGSLSLSYPGFYQPIISNGAWSILMFNTSFYSNEEQVGGAAWRGDGVYAFQAWAYGYERLAQAVGLLTTDDIWPCVMVYFTVVLIGIIVLFQLWFWGRWALYKLTGVEEEDLTRKNWPYTAGLLCRFTFTYFLIPVVTACAFQLTVAARSAVSITASAAVILVLILLISSWLSYTIYTYHPRSELYDILPTLITFGTFYNTYREKSLVFFMSQLYINIMRAIAFGALQPSGIAQITILAACEIVMILSIYAIKPFAPPTSMNLWHFVFACVRLLTILLMMAFVPSINAADAVKGWTGWVILGIHAAVLLFGFVLKALQTLLEVAVRGYRSDEEAARGGFAKVFGVRQLSRRKRHSQQTHRSHDLSPTPISATERKHTLHNVSSRLPHSRTNSSAAMLLGSPATEHIGGILPEGSQSAHAHSNSGSTSAGFTPTTPGAASGHGYTPPVDNVAGPYYRPPRTRRIDGPGDQYSPATAQSRGSYASDISMKQGAQRESQGSVLGGGGEASADDAARSTPAPGGGHRYTESAITVGSGRGNTDYATRESDFYYGVRGPALSAQPQRRLGTGPADPTGPVSNAKSWIKQKLGLARGEKEKGFSVVRSSRAPEEILAARRQVEEEEEAGRNAEETVAEEGIGMAVTSDDPDAVSSESESENEYSDTDPAEEPGPSSRMLHGSTESKPIVPRKSSKRKSREPRPLPQRLYDPPITRGSTSRLPFEEDSNTHGESHSRTTSSASRGSSSVLEPPALIRTSEEGRPASGESIGRVSQGRVGAVVRDERGDITGSQAELVRGGSGSTKASSRRSKAAK